MIGSHRETLEGLSGWVTSMAFSPDGKYLRTDRGILSLLESALSKQNFEKTISDFDLFVNKEWILLDGKERL